MSALWQLTHYFLVQAVLHLLNDVIFLEADDGTRSSLLRASKHIYELLRLELLWQLTETLTIKHEFDITSSLSATNSKISTIFCFNSCLSTISSDVDFMNWTISACRC